MTTATNLQTKTVHHLLFRWIQFNYMDTCSIERILKDMKFNNYFDDDTRAMTRHLMDLIDSRGLNEQSTLNDLRMKF